jgi:DNA (cytosine-5)-methyltransferase 1
MADLFSGAGGLSLGLEQAGFRSVMAVEIVKDACQTYSRLFPSANLMDTTIETLDFRHLRGRVDLVAGGPPCQPFSSGGKRLANADQRDMLPQYLRAIAEIQPPVFLMENVFGLATGDRAAYLEGFLTEFRNLGYEVTWKVVHAAEYGVPQKRRRLFVVGSRVGSFAFPAPTHGPQAGVPYARAGDVLSRDRVIGTPNQSKVFYAKNPDLRPSFYDGHLFNGGGRPIHLDDLCPTILASAGGNKTHFIDTLDEVPGYHAALLRGEAPRVGTLPGGRRITVAESALIQTFPADVQFAGSSSSQYTQVGNAVPPRLAAQVGKALAELLLGHAQATAD